MASQRMAIMEQISYRQCFRIRSNLRGAVVPIAATLFSLSIGPVLAWWYQVDGQTADVTVRLVLPDRIGEWYTASESRGAWRPEIQGADSADSKVYTKAGTEPVELYAFYYYRQWQGKEAISDMNRIADGKEWSVMHSRQRQIGNADTGTSVEETLIRSAAGQEKLVWRWYSVNGTRTDNRLVGKIQNIIGTLTGDPTITVLAVAAEHQEYGRTSEVLASFVTGNMDHIDDVIRGIRQR